MTTRKREGNWDCVVVGAGSSGAVIAARMSERSDASVLLLEAGPDYPTEQGVPSDLRDGTRNSMRRHDWGYHHEPTRGHIPFAFPRGKVVGGSSAVNTCIALRGQPYDFDEWASMGLADWSFDRCLPAFKRLERDLDIDNSWHGQTGPIPIRRHPDHELSHWQRAFMQACASLGFERCEDTNNPDTTGFGPHAMNKVNGVRMSASRCYLTPEVRARESLTIRARTRVDRVNITNRRVTGLHVQTEGRAYTIAAKKVVLSAGAIATPGILLRSGIGARHMLERFGVDVVSDLPAVGARLLDHPGLAIFLRPYERPDFSEPLIQTVLRFTSRDSPYRNDVQIQPGTFVPFSRITLPLVSVMCAIGKPRSTGRLIYASAHPEEMPRIHSDFFEDPRDRQMAVEAIGLAWQCVSTEPMRELARPFWPTPRTLANPAAIERVLPKICGSGYHPCGTVPMAPEGDLAGAVDGRGRVRGVEGLLVADASVMPTIPSANTNLTTLMIGERFGEWLRDGAA